MRAATGKDTLIESVLALAKGEIGGLAFLNPTDANDGHVVTFDKTLNKFVLKPAAGEIDQNLLLFASASFLFSSASLSFFILSKILSIFSG